MAVAEASPPLPFVQAAPILHLFAQDTHWVHAYWEIAEADQQRLRALSSSGRLVLRVFKNLHQGEPVQELDLDPVASDWFVKVAEAGATYVADLGCYQMAGEWVCAAVSNATSTPADSMTAEGEVRFQTISPEMPLLPAVSGSGEAGAVSEAAWGVPGMAAEPMPALQVQPWPAPAGPRSEATRLPPQEPGGLAAGPPLDQSAWTPAQSKVMAEILSAQEQSRRPAGSIQIAELARAGVEGIPGPAQPAEEGVPLGAPEGPVGISSLAVSPAEAGPPRQFWFNVNAELVIYGGTEPDAMVAIGGRPIRLRPDGTFSYRFALPDGIFALAAEAVPADGTERRLAEMSFSRVTRYEGEVGVHPHSAGLKPPSVEALE